MRFIHSIAALALAASVAACADSAEPSSDNELAFNRSSTGTPGTGRHLVKFGTSAGSGFAEQVASLGGRVEWTGAGLAALSGLDSLLSIVQMPKGVPVATVAIGPSGAANAGLLAVAILAVSRPDLRAKLQAFRDKMAADVRASSVGS